MILGILESISDVFTKFGNFVEKNYDEPFFWLAIFAILLVIALYGISNFADK